MLASGGSVLVYPFLLQVAVWQLHFLMMMSLWGHRFLYALTAHGVQAILKVGTRLSSFRPPPPFKAGVFCEALMWASWLWLRSLAVYCTCAPKVAQLTKLLLVWAAQFPVRFLPLPQAIPGQAAKSQRCSPEKAGLGILDLTRKPLLASVQGGPSPAKIQHGPRLTCRPTQHVAQRHPWGVKKISWR